MESDKFILYPAADGRPEIQLRVQDGTVWLSQAEIAQLFGTSTPNINIHIRNILREQEQSVDSVVKESLITAADGKSCQTKSCHREILPSAKPLRPVEKTHSADLPIP